MGRWRRGDLIIIRHLVVVEADLRVEVQKVNLGGRRSEILEYVEKFGYKSRQNLLSIIVTLLVKFLYTSSWDAQFNILLMGENDHLLC
jgi:hypothetical protein